MRVAALFVDPKGIYPALVGADMCWDESRDARTYAGPWPVVAHPPCRLWGPMARVNFARYGGEHNRPGNDGGCFASALATVRRVGGVIEHPADTMAWPAHSLPKPLFGKRGRGWTFAPCGGYVCEVWQSAYGHLARKRTWLYWRSVDPAAGPPPELDWTRNPGTHRIGHNAYTRTHKPRLEGRAASATPPAFAECLIMLARKAGV
jgi:hypothetical protein